jgi:hypothetical protein
MSKISRDSFKETHNVLNELRGLGPAQPNAKQYVAVRLQQGVPVLDADFNEVDDIRRAELELILARAIGNGVPAGSDGFKVLEAATTNNFVIEASLIFLDGWWIFNPARVDYLNQPHRNTRGLAPSLRVLQNIPVAQRELAYLDAWELVVDGQEDTSLINPKIGVETCARIERGWVVRLEPIAANADPLVAATIPNRQPGHRYYPLALINRPPGGQISAAMMTDLRRTHLTLEATTFAPLLIDDPVRGQRLDSARLAGAFRGNLDAMRDTLALKPEIFVYAARPAETSQGTTALGDVRASAISFEQQARNQLLHRAAAGNAMQTFYETERSLMNTLQAFVNSGIAGAPTTAFLTTYRNHLEGAVANDPQSLKFALGASDLLGAVMAQERLNQALAQDSDTLPEGTVTASLISITPIGPLADNTVQAHYLLTIRIQSNLTSAQGAEPVRAIASAGPGWTLAFQGSVQPDLRETVATVQNQQTADVVLDISASPGAANTTLNLTFRPERRQQLVYNHPPQTMALGQELIPGTILGSLGYQGPPLQPGNHAVVDRSVMAQVGGVPLPFGVGNPTGVIQTYQVTVTPLSAATGWQPPNQPILAPINPGGSRNVNITFRTTDQTNAVSPLTYRVQLTRVTGGANEPLVYTRFDITFDLT